jgi:hypothetical protein
MLLVSTEALEARFPRPRRRGAHEARRQRRIYTDDIFNIVPGNLEIEFGTNAGRDLVTFPAVLKYEPDVPIPFIRHSEISLSSDTLTSILSNGNRTTQFSDQHSLVIFRPVLRREAFTLAVDPQMTFFTRGAHGVRLGSGILAGYAFGLNGAIASFTWTGATSSSPTNPAREQDFEFTYYHQLGWGAASRFMAFGDFLHVRATEQQALSSVTEGIIYHLRPNLALDFGIRQQDIGSGRISHQLVGGITVGLGRIH